MATIYSGFHVKLKSPLTPWSDRLKLARFAWTSRQCFLPNKEQVLFDWVSHALSCYYNKKVQVPLEVVEDLWTYLDEILHSKKLYNVLNQGKTITLNPSLAKFVVRESREVATLTSSLIVPVVDTLTTLLRQGESWLSNPHNIILVLGALHFVPLENQSMEDYYSAFQAIHEALFAIILCYPKIMLKSAPTFLNCFYRLVTSIIHEGKQKEKDSEKLLKCARLVERMYTHIGKTAEGFSILSSFMVAQYVNELQKVTLRPEIKAHLTEGIYCILDQCIENDIKFLNRTLQKGLKEVFDELYKNYTRYHKSQWQGEEKYTA
uniref:Nucleolar 27S pre-rRNA processing Urb2/Npa2 C-terminal domain-containing protein n=1 Tax=Electrophorus electricus TaxID=8005 RepID=A0AAY5EUJ1_ELEEL